MKKFVFCLSIALTVFSVSSFAQQGGGAERMKQMLKDSLSLTDVQIDSVMAVSKDFGPQRRDIMMDQSASQEDKMAKMKDIQAQMKVRFKGFLSDDQIAKLEAMQQRMRGGMRRGGPGGGGGGNQ